MAKGTSQSWQLTLQEVIGEGRLDGSALREYFRPLEEWLRNENLRNQEFVGWNYDGDYCKNRWDQRNLNLLKFIEDQTKKFISASKHKIFKFLEVSTTTHHMFR